MIACPAASKDHEHVIISSNSRGSSEVHLLDAREPVSDPVLVQPREDGLEYFVQPVMGHLVILTNAGGTDDYWVAVCPAEKTTKEHWETLVPLRNGDRHCLGVGHAGASRTGDLRFLLLSLACFSYMCVSFLHIRPISQFCPRCPFLQASVSTIWTSLGQQWCC